MRQHRAAPWGHLIICEDGPSGDYVRGVAPDGRVYAIARSAESEVAGACFSPDGEIMFVNVQKPGITVAITGPWASIALA
ncbi:MAG: alkaline phosphatase PhoX [Pseudomonadota bacterium]